MTAFAPKCAENIRQKSLARVCLQTWTLKFAQGAK
jgi:hypothetical protein